MSCRGSPESSCSHVYRPWSRKLKQGGISPNPKTPMPAAGPFRPRRRARRAVYTINSNKRHRQTYTDRHGRRRDACGGKNQAPILVNSDGTDHACSRVHTCPVQKRKEPKCNAKPRSQSNSSSWKVQALYLIAPPCIPDDSDASLASSRMTNPAHATSTFFPYILAL